MTTFLILIGVILAAVAFTDERVGFYIAIFVGLTQDMVRKVLPGEPVVLTVLVGVFVGALMLGMLTRGQIRFGAFMQTLPDLRLPMTVFLWYVAGQCIMAFINTRSPVVVAIGALVYFGPMAVLYLGYYLTATREDAQVVRYMRWYVLIAAILSVGVYMEYMGSQWDLLRNVGIGLHGYNPLGGVLKLHNGFWRGSELAGGYLGLAAIFCIVMFIYGRVKLGFNGILVIIFLGLMLAVFITGRRKFLMEVLMFIIAYGALSIVLKRGMNRIVQFVVLSILFGLIGFLWFVPQEFKENLDGYVARGAQLEDQTSERFVGLNTIGFYWTYRHNGFWGKGAGVASQGAQHFGGGAAVVGAASEGGLGKVMAELGVPGLAIIVWFGFAVLRRIYMGLKEMSYGYESRMQLTHAVVAVIIANLAVFSIAVQIFGDVFYLFMISWLIGSLLALSNVHLNRPVT